MHEQITTTRQVAEKLLEVMTRQSASLRKMAELTDQLADVVGRFLETADESGDSGQPPFQATAA